MTGPPLTLEDSLAALLKGRPAAILYKEPPEGPTAGGSYRSRTPYSAGDTIYVDPAGNSLGAPQNYVLSHEMGHRLFEQNDPNRSLALKPEGIQDPELVRLASDLRKKNEYSGHFGSEALAEAFGNAVGSANASPRHPAYHDPRADPDDERRLAAWVMKQPLYRDWLGSQIVHAKQEPDALALTQRVDPQQNASGTMQWIMQMLRPK